MNMHINIKQQIDSIDVTTLLNKKFINKTFFKNPLRRLIIISVESEILFQSIVRIQSVKMDNIKLQTLKRPVEKPNPNVVIEEIALELKNVRNAYKPTVQTRRIESYDVEEEEEVLSIKQQEEEVERLSHFFPTTRELLNAEIHHYKKVFDNAIKEYENKDEYCKKDQEDLKKSDQTLEKKMARYTRLQTIRNALDQDITVYLHTSITLNFKIFSKKIFLGNCKTPRKIRKTSRG